MSRIPTALYAVAARRPFTPGKTLSEARCVRTLGGRLIRVTAIYLNAHGAHFDHDYYRRGYVVPRLPVGYRVVRYYDVKSFPAYGQAGELFAGLRSFQ